MAQTEDYLRGVGLPPSRTSQRTKTIGLWIVMVFLFLVVYALLTPNNTTHPPHPPEYAPGEEPSVKTQPEAERSWPAALGIWSTTALLGGWLWWSIEKQRRAFVLQARFGQRIQEDDFEGAQTLAAAQLSVAKDERGWATWAMLLADAALKRGDFAAAQELSARGQTALETQRTRDQQKGPEPLLMQLRLARAFALLSLGRTHEASALLGAEPDEPPALLRAQFNLVKAVLLQAQGQREALQQHLATTRAVFERELRFREQWLARVLEAWAFEQSPVPVPRSALAWVQQAAPSARSAIIEASA